ncbi:unnamed protein product, partial [Amoebophrya sp. A120]|eukprot:GSA120T00004504001.1
MWASDFLNAEPVAKTYLTHLKANNLFLRYWFRENYLPPRCRSGALLRLIRLFLALSIYLIITSHVVDYANWENGKLCMRRLDCKISCVLENFPTLSCFLKTGFSIYYGDNEYSKLYDFHLGRRHEAKSVTTTSAIAADAELESSKAFNECRYVAFPNEKTSLVDEDRFLTSSLPETRNTNSLQSYQGRLPRTQVCFPNCRATVPSYPGESLFGKQYSKAALEQNTVFVNYQQGPFNASLKTFFPHETEFSELPSGVQAVVSAVTDLENEQVQYYTLTGDSRPSCAVTLDSTGTEISIYNPNHLVCVDDSDECEKIVYKNEICFDSDNTWCFTVQHIILAMSIALPILFLYNVLIFWTTILDDRSLHLIASAGAQGSGPGGAGAVPAGTGDGAGGGGSASNGGNAIAG